MANYPTIDLVCPVWGESYITQFINLSLPSLLSPHNLPMLCKTRSLRWVFYTDQQSGILLSQSHLLQSHAQDIEITYRYIPNSLLKQKMKYRIASLCYADSLKQAQENKSQILLLTADMLLSEGSLEYLEEILAQDPVLIMAEGLRLLLEPLTRMLKQRTPLEHSGLSASELLKFFIQYKHPLAQVSFRDAPLFTSFPNRVYEWLKPEQAFQVNSYHLHPLFIAEPYLYREDSIFPTIDGAYLQNFYPERSRIYIVRDKSLVLGSLSSIQDGFIYIPQAYSALERELLIQEFAKSPYCLPIHHFFFKQSIIFEAN